MPRSWRMAFGLSGLMASATAMRPRSLPFFANSSGVLPACESASACFSISCGSASCEAIYRTLPPSSCAPRTVAFRPLPVMAAKSSAASGWIWASSPRFMMAAASGCSLLASSETAACSSSCSVTPEAGMRSVTSGWPEVMVPVLSSATMRVRPVCSRLAAVLKRMPFFAPTPLPTMMATGVARPSAHGQLMTSTEMPRASAKENSRPISSHTIVVTTAIEMTAGTNTPATLSAVLAIGAFVAAASETMRMIWLSVVSSPTRVASQRRKPEQLTVAADTPSPGALSTGTLSPVRAASLTALAPSSTMPSTGMLCPGRTTKISPFLTCAAGIFTSLPSRMTVAVSGARAMRLLSASVVLPLDLASSSLPTVMSVRIMAADSK